MFLMGCMSSIDQANVEKGLEQSINDNARRSCSQCHSLCYRDASIPANTIPTPSAINEKVVDLTHFSPPQEILGIGGFGIVRKVTKLTGSDTNEDYAMKSMSKATVLSRPSGTTAVMTELKTLTIVQQCDFICSIQYAFQDDSFLYLCLDYAVAGDLRYNLRKAPSYRFSEQLSRMFIYQVLQAVDHCHKCSILHRDIKPENVLLFSNGLVKLTDFGVAKLLHDIEQCKSTSGTHGYMAPEIYTGDHNHGTAFDWFCCGITLHEFLTGRRPYEAARLQRYYTTIPRDRLELDVLQKSMTSMACKAFVTKVVRANVEDRLGAKHGMRELLSHDWMQSFNFSPIEILQVVREELPYFAQSTLAGNQSQLNGSAMGRHNVHRFNIDKEEALEILRTHQIKHVIAPEIQEVFREFEFNTKTHPKEGAANQRQRISTSTTSSTYDQYSVLSQTIDGERIDISVDSNAGNGSICKAAYSNEKNQDAPESSLHEFTPNIRALARFQAFVRPELGHRQRKNTLFIDSTSIRQRV